MHLSPRKVIAATALAVGAFAATAVVAQAIGCIVDSGYRLICGRGWTRRSLPMSRFPSNVIGR
jgi:hypothetical protein